MTTRLAPAIIDRIGPLVLELLSTGPIHSDSGRASSVLAEALDEDRLLVTHVLENLEHEGKIVREINGRRTHVIRLPIDGETPEQIRDAAIARTTALRDKIERNRANNGSPLSLVERRKNHPTMRAVPVVVETPTPEPETPTVVEEWLDVEAVAGALLRQVLDLATAPQRANAQHEQTERDFAAVRVRLNDAVEESQRMRKRVRALEDECAAYKITLDGLRSRCQQAEANLKRTLQSPPLDVERERELRQLVKTMQTKPGAYAGNRLNDERHHG